MQFELSSTDQRRLLRADCALEAGLTEPMANAAVEGWAADQYRSPIRARWGRTIARRVLLQELMVPRCSVVPLLGCWAAVGLVLDCLCNVSNPACC